MANLYLGTKAVHQLAAENGEISLMADESQLAGTVAEERMQGLDLLVQVDSHE